MTRVKKKKNWRGRLFLWFRFLVELDEKKKENPHNTRYNLRDICSIVSRTGSVSQKMRYTTNLAGNICRRRVRLRIARMCRNGFSRGKSVPVVQRLVPTTNEKNPNTTDFRTAENGNENRSNSWWPLVAGGGKQCAVLTVEYRDSRVVSSAGRLDDGCLHGGAQRVAAAESAAVTSFVTVLCTRVKPTIDISLTKKQKRPRPTCVQTKNR